MYLPLIAAKRLLMTLFKAYSLFMIFMRPADNLSRHKILHQFKVWPDRTIWSYLPVFLLKPVFDLRGMVSFFFFFFFFFFFKYVI